MRFGEDAIYAVGIEGMKDIVTGVGKAIT